MQCSRHLGRIQRGLAALLLAGGLVCAAAPALARTEMLHWSHPSPRTVQGFHVYWGSSAGHYTRNVDAGLPARDAAGNYVYSLNVPASGAIYIAVTAYNASGQESAFSNEQVRGASGGAPGGAGQNAAPPSPSAPPAPPAPPATSPPPASTLGSPGRPELLTP